jgi:nicotinamide-nucleotide amidase
MSDKEYLRDLVIPDRVRDILLINKQTVAVAESVTAGHLQVAFSMAEHAQEFFQGGITVYNLGQKSRHLQVNPIHALSCNSVSEQVAAEMAKNVTSFFMSDWGIAVTGYASPVPEKNIYELYACYSFSFRDKEVIRETVTVENSTPGEVRRFYTKHILDHFLEMLEKQ